MLRWGGVNGQTEVINGTYISEGTLPKGSTWAMNPIPCHQSGTPTFSPKCKEDPRCRPNTADSQYCRCSGDIANYGPYNLEIVDVVMVPAGLPPGEYVLGWRWDCEESNQIWSSCSDVTVVSSSPLPTPIATSGNKWKLVDEKDRTSPTITEPWP